MKSIYYAENQIKSYWNRNRPHDSNQIILNKNVRFYIITYYVRPKVTILYSKVVSNMES